MKVRRHNNIDESTGTKLLISLAPWRSASVLANVERRSERIRFLTMRRINLARLQLVRFCVGLTHPISDVLSLSRTLNRPVVTIRFIHPTSLRHSLVADTCLRTP
jgi:hypothetical protein